MSEEEKTDISPEQLPVEGLPQTEADSSANELAATAYSVVADVGEAKPHESAAEVTESAATQAEPLKLDGIKQKGPRVPMPSSLQEIIGALLFASESPLTAGELRTCVRGVAPEEGEDSEVMSVYQSCTSREIEQALHGLEKELERSGCGFHLVCAGGAYRLQTVPSCGRYVRALLKLDRPNRLSRAALETLAIIAYRQPVTKAEIEQIRGVAVDTIVKSLVDLQLVRLVGRSELPGHPFLYGTSPLFLEHFGLASLSELNEIDPTLQRSNPRERAKLFVKEKKEEKPAQENADESANKPASNQSEINFNVPAGAESQTSSEAAATSDDSDIENDVAAENDDGEAEDSPRRVSFRPGEEEEEEFDDDEPLTDDDDEPLTDDDDDSDDEFLTDDDDEPLTDDDEPLTDDDEEEEFDEEDEEGEEDDDDE